jgi:glycine/D-amino acid oxidase-like deaminating enzyme
MDQSVLIIGRGIAGLSAGYALSGVGVKVVIIGPAESTSTATHAAVGLSSLKGQFHAQKPLFAAKVDGHRMLWSWLQEVESASEVPIPRFQVPSFEPYWTVTEYEFIRERVFHRSFSGHTGAVTGDLPSAVLARFKDCPRGAAVYDGDIWYDPRSCLRALAAAITRRGGLIVDDSVLRIKTEESCLHVVGSGNEYVSPHVILAAGVGCDKVLEASGIKAPKQKAVFGETLVFDKLPHSSPQIIHMGKKHMVAWEDMAMYGSSSELLGEAGGYLQKDDNPTLDLDQRLSIVGVNNTFSTRLSGIRGRYTDMAPCVGPVNLPGSEAQLILFSGFYKSGLQLAPLFAGKLASFFCDSSAFFCDPQFSVARFSSRL